MQEESSLFWPFQEKKLRHFQFNFDFIFLVKSIYAVFRNHIKLQFSYSMPHFSNSKKKMLD